MTYDEWRPRFWIELEACLGVHGSELDGEQRQFNRWLVSIKCSGMDHDKAFVQIRELPDIPSGTAIAAAIFPFSFYLETNPETAARTICDQLSALGDF